MGLDQYAGRIVKNLSGTEHAEEFFYWRKQNHIQNWMQKLYAKKTGVDSPDDFNCVSVELTKEDILHFIDDAVNQRMKCTDGFFFGYVYDPYHSIESDMEFAGKALAEIAMGNKVVYSSWW